MAALIHELTNEASFIFEGTLRQIGAVTSASLPAGPDMAVVHVGKILKGPHVLAGFSGQEITIQLRHPGSAQHGRQATFFTTGLHFGGGLAVREVGQLDRTGAEVEAEVKEAMAHAYDDALRARLEAAELVVAGTAVRVGPLRTDDATSRQVSEHDPDWWECEIKVSDVEKGKLPAAGRGRAAGSEVVTLFAHSTDIVWYQSPKFNEGEEGIWLLHRTDFRGAPVPGLVTDHPLDFHPLSRIERIRALLGRTPR
jgi:hypothetical protein